MGVERRQWWVLGKRAELFHPDDTTGEEKRLSNPDRKKIIFFGHDRQEDRR